MNAPRVIRARHGLSSPPPLAGEVGRPTGPREARPDDRLRDSEGGREGEFLSKAAPSPSLPRKRGREHIAAPLVSDKNVCVDYAV